MGHPLSGGKRSDNRTRLPQYPKTICGVVYQGASRSTGCQFSFACDGYRTRRPKHAGWDSARTAARRAIAGAVLKPVGRATHYHTDWILDHLDNPLLAALILPYWMPSLDKIAQARSQIFNEPRRVCLRSPTSSQWAGYEKCVANLDA